MSAPRTDPLVWSRGRLIAVIAAVTAAAVLLTVAFGFAVYSAIRTDPATDTARSEAVQGLPSDRDQRRDVLAAQPMLQVARNDSLQGVPSTQVGPVLAVPSSTVIGPAKVASGFPQTPEGAIGQLASIEVSVLSEMSIARTNEVYDAWTASGAAPVDQWRLMGHVQAFLAAANMGQVKDPRATVTVTPVAAQTKASDGPDWTIACVLVDVRAVIKTQARMAYGYCERMQWDGERWMIAPGFPPADAPSTWPGTDLAFEAGWRTWARDAR